MAAVGMKLKKKHVIDRRDGMNDETRRHFENVKQKMFAFIHLQNQMNADGEHLATTPVPHLTPGRVFDEPKIKKISHHHHHHHRHRSPEVPRKQIQPPITPHIHLRNLPFGTPQVVHRLRK